MPSSLYFFAFVWGIVLLGSFAGWGFAVTRLLWLPPDWGQASARGIALGVVVGGLLNLAHAISSPLLLGWVGVGLVLLMAERFRAPRRRAPGVDRGGWGLLDLLAATALLTSYSTWLCLDARPTALAPSQAYWLNVSDDMYGYALFPSQMLQTGAMADDPFNDRRTTSGLGGEPFLQSLGLLFLPLPYIHGVDPGVAHLATVLGLYGMGRRRRWPCQLPGALSFLYLLLPTDAWNASAISLPVVLLLSLYRTMADERPTREGLLRDAMATALPLSALLALKNTMLPGGLAIVGLGILARMIVERRFGRPAIRGFLIGVLTLAMLAPWMIASYRACGSALYPLLGEGFRGHTAIAFPHKQSNRDPSALVRQVGWVLRARKMNIATGAAMLAVVVLAMGGGGSPRRRWATWAVLAGSGLTVGLYLLMFPMTASYRYSYPFVAIIMLVSLATVLGRDRRRIPLAGPRRGLAYLAIGLMTLLAPLLAYGFRINVPYAIDAARGGMIGRPFVPEGEPERHRRLQEHIPAGARVFCMADTNLYVLKPILFDFARNPLFVHDIPGGVSPPPGIPISGDPEALAAYLRSQGFRYVVMRRELDPADRLIEAFEGLKGEDNWVYSMQVNYATMAALLSECADRYPILYEEGGLVVLDLGEGGPRGVGLDQGSPDTRPEASRPGPK
ncbi:hypothetical protein P12x_000005 [Tundrisphaera lichenicola]|uniref:hypothetical protein n=1 Tax=Tundrisphaera lichenicola TaxID=2029860 RepID=UPI003EBF5593